MLLPLLLLNLDPSTVATVETSRAVVASVRVHDVPVSREVVPTVREHDVEAVDTYPPD